MAHFDQFTEHKIGVGAGAGAGGGLSLNAPGAAPKVRHFAAGGGKKSGPAVDPEVEATWKLIMSEESEVDWMIATYDATGKAVALSQKGEGMSLKNFCAALHETEGCAWGGFRCNGVDNRGALVCKRPKFVFVQYMPPTAPPMRRAKMGSHKGALKAALDGAHMDVLVENIEEDLEKNSLCSKLQAATGAHKPNGYEFDKDEITDADYYKDVALK